MERKRAYTYQELANAMENYEIGRPSTHELDKMRLETVLEHFPNVRYKFNNSRSLLEMMNRIAPQKAFLSGVELKRVVCIDAATHRNDISYAAKIALRLKADIYMVVGNHPELVKTLQCGQPVKVITERSAIPLWAYEITVDDVTKAKEKDKFFM